MGEFVKLRLNTYDRMKEHTEELKENILELDKTRQHLERIIDRQTDTIIELHRFIMGENLITHYFKEYQLEDLTDFDNYMTFAINYKDTLLNIGIIKKEMIEFIEEKYNEWKKEEDRNDR